MNTSDKIFYVYIYLNPLKPGKYVYTDDSDKQYKFDYEPFYVGKGKGRRAKYHLTKSNLEKDVNKLKTNIIKKIFKENKKPIIKVVKNLYEQHSLDLEMKMVKLIGRRDLKEGTLANMTDGGDGISGFKHSQKYKNKMSITRLNKTFIEIYGVDRAKDIRESMSKSLKGRKLSLDQIEKMSNRLKGLSFIDIHGEDRAKEIKQKMSISRKGNKQSYEWKEKIGNANRGKKNGMYGKDPWNKGLRKRDHTKDRKWIIIDDKCNVYTFIGTIKHELKQFCEYMNLSFKILYKNRNKGMIQKLLNKRNTDSRLKLINWEIKEEYI